MIWLVLLILFWLILLTISVEKYLKRIDNSLRNMSTDSSRTYDKVEHIDDVLRSGFEETGRSSGGSYIIPRCKY